MDGHPEEDIPENDLTISTSLGFGSPGEAKPARHPPTNTQAAVKVPEKNHNAVSGIQSEVQILQSPEHRNTVRSPHIIDTQKMSHVSMEYVPGRDPQMLPKNTGHLKEEDARSTFQQVVSAVHSLHKRRTAHRDTKLENIPVDGCGNTKPRDFGLAIQLKEGQMLKKVRGSPLHVAPEIPARKPYDGPAGDMWSPGAVPHALATGQHPHPETTAHDLHRLTTNTKLATPLHLSQARHLIIAQPLQVSTQHRTTTSQPLQRKWLQIPGLF